MMFEYQMQSLASEMIRNELVDSREILIKYFECNDNELDILGNYIDIAEHFEIYSDKLIEYTNRISDKTDYNSLLFTTMKVIFETITNLIERSINEYAKNPKELKEKLDKLIPIKNNFAPIITITQVVFNNYLDAVELRELPDYPDKAYMNLIEKWE